MLGEPFPLFTSDFQHPSSSLSDFVNQSIEMATRSPDIVAEVDHDLDVHGLKKKALRDADRLYFEQNVNAG
jgi:hypothetical protein